MLLETLSAPMWMTVQATGKIRNYQLIISSVICLNIILSFIFLYLGASPLIVMEIKCSLDLVYLAIRLLFMKSKVHLSIMKFMKEVIGAILPISLFTVISLYAIKALRLSELSYFLVSIVTFFLLYFPCTYYFVMGEKERSKVLSFIKKRISKQ